jgi:hypothetical protein
MSDEEHSKSLQPSESDAPLPMLHGAHHRAAAQDPVLERLENMVEALLQLPPPSVPCTDRPWRALFLWCNKHRHHLAMHARRCLKSRSQQRVDLWLCELASPPKGMWEGVRHGLLPFIRLVGLPPRGDGEPMFTATHVNGELETAAAAKNQPGPGDSPGGVSTY